MVGHRVILVSGIRRHQNLNPWPKQGRVLPRPRRLWLHSRPKLRRRVLRQAASYQVQAQVAGWQLQRKQRLLQLVTLVCPQGLPQGMKTGPQEASGLQHRSRHHHHRTEIMPFKSWPRLLLHLPHAKHPCACPLGKLTIAQGLAMHQKG